MVLNIWLKLHSNCSSNLIQNTIRFSLHLINSLFERHAENMPRAPRSVNPALLVDETIRAKMRPLFKNNQVADEELIEGMSFGMVRQEFLYFSHCKGKYLVKLLLDKEHIVHHCLNGGK